MLRGFPKPPVWAVVVMAAGLLFLIAGLTVIPRPAPPPYTPRAVAAPTTPPTVRFAAVGDSVTAGDSPDFHAGQVGSRSWVRYAVGDPAQFTGGWAVPGAATGQMLAQVGPLQADVLVVLLGTNDTGQGIPFVTSAANIKAIASKVGAPRVILCSIPPRDEDPQPAVDYNRQLQQLAAAQHWQFVDAMAGVRSGDQYAAGMSDDGIHPTPKAAQIIGAAIRSTLLAAS